MPKSIFFIVGGVLLVGMGFALERARKKHGAARRLIEAGGDSE